VSEHLAATDTTVWLDLCGPSRAELDGLARELGLHELAVESAVRPQRPRLVRYATHQFIAVPTLITGYFGMNVPYPGSEDVVGVVASAGPMILACLLLYHLFRRSQWLATLAHHQRPVTRRERPFAGTSGR
jgi:Mg2+ and Co2+ transporter CorA